jgi:hypothetical protein
MTGIYLKLLKLNIGPEDGPTPGGERTVKDFYELSSIRTYGERQVPLQRPSNPTECNSVNPAWVEQVADATRQAVKSQ